MINNIFPPKDNPEISDEEWEKYCIGVWCCNSLNATEGLYGHLKTKYIKPGVEFIVIPARLAENTEKYLRRAQNVIHYLQDKLEQGEIK